MVNVNGKACSWWKWHLSGILCHDAITTIYTIGGLEVDPQFSHQSSINDKGDKKKKNLGRES